MASPDGTGYLIPENPTPNELNCLLVFYPDDPMYLQALLGSLTYLGTWTAWERDAAKRGRLAAAAWKDANDCTFDAMGCLTELVSALTGINQTLAAIQAAIENQELAVDTGDLVLAVNGVQAAIESQQISLDAGDLLPALTGIQTAIENQELMCNCGAGGEGDDMGTVNVYCGCCGSGGTGTGTADQTIPDNELPDVPIPINDENPPVNPDPSTKCGMANYLAYTLRLTLLRSIEHTGDINSFRDAFKILWDGVTGVTTDWIAQFIKPFSIGVYTWLMQRLNGKTSMVLEVSSAFDAVYNMMVCGMFTAEDEVGAWSAVVDALQSSSLPPTAREAGELIASYLPYKLLFTEAGEITPPPGFTNRSCCGSVQDGVEPLPEMPDSSYVILPALLDAEAVSPDDIYNNILSEGPFGQGYKYSATIRRSGGFANGASSIVGTLKTRTQLDAMFGAGNWEYIGVMLSYGNYTGSPIDPKRQQTVPDNFINPKPTQWAPGTRMAYLVPGTAGDDLAELTEYTVSRTATTDRFTNAGNTPIMKVNLVTQDSGDYVLYTVSQELRGFWEIYRIINAP